MLHNISMNIRGDIMICSKCGKETDDMLSVCEHCGEPKDNNAVLLKKTDDSPTVLIENEKSYDEENTILLEEDEDDGRFISGVLDADQSIKTASDDKFFANNDYVPSASDENKNRRNTFNDNDSTMSFDAIDGIEYIVDPRRSYGYVDRYWGKTLPETWFHISASNLASIISGKALFNSSFAIQGSFEDRVSFLGNFEGTDIEFCADEKKRQVSVIWDCSQMPECDDPEDNQLHWSVSLHNKIWVIDVDIYCKIKELNNRNVELPEGQRKVLNMLEGGTGVGEIKLYKKVSNTLEMIESAKIQKAVCEFGHLENLSEN